MSKAHQSLNLSARFQGWLVKRPCRGRIRSVAAGVLAGLVLMLAPGCGSAQKPPARDAAAGGLGRKGGVAPASAGGGTNAVPASLQPRQAAFSTSLDAGKDPFFPNSARRQAKPRETGAAVAQAKPAVAGQLKLTGLWPSKTRPLALINKTSLTVGERAEVSVMSPSSKEVHKYKVCLLEVRPRSVLITVEGEPGIKELQLPEMQ